jgi:hypothetical protein
VGGTSQDRGGSQISERPFDHGRTFISGCTNHRDYPNNSMPLIITMAPAVAP